MSLVDSFHGVAHIRIMDEKSTQNYCQFSQEWCHLWPVRIRLNRCFWGMIYKGGKGAVA